MKNVKYSLFADDVAIWSSHRDLYIAEERVRTGLNQIASLCEIWGFTLSAEKSAAMAFNKGRLRHPTKLLINAKPIKDVKEFNPSTPKKRALIPFKFEVIFNYDNFFSSWHKVTLMAQS